MTQKPNILIIADGFGAPSYNPRLRTLCDYLAQQAYHFSVVVEHIADLPFEHNYPIHELHLYSGSKIDWALKNTWSLLTDWKNRRFSHLVEQQFGQQHFDIVFCTTFHTCPLRAAIDFGKRHHIPVITDIRDLAEQAPNNQADYLAHKHPLLQPFVKPYQRINIHRRNRQLRLATAVTTVSPWHVDFLKKLNPDTHLIYNGFDANIFKPNDQCPYGVSRSEEMSNVQFTLSYSGKFFGKPLHNPDLLFQALSQLPDIPYRLIIHTDPHGQQLLRQLAQLYHVHADINGYIPQHETLQLYHQSAIILVFTNTASDHNGHGLMTTKFFEALGVEKPVLCVRSDEDCLAEVIKQTNAGLAATNVEEVKAFILDKYREWQENGFTHQAVRDKQIFTRQYQAKQFESIICQQIPL